MSTIASSAAASEGDKSQVDDRSAVHRKPDHWGRYGRSGHRHLPAAGHPAGPAGRILRLMKMCLRMACRRSTKARQESATVPAGSDCAEILESYPTQNVIVCYVLR